MMPDAGNILVVEDETGVRNALVDSLERQGHRVIACPSAEESLMWVRQSPPDVVIADLGVPGVGGLQILRILKDWICRCPALTGKCYSSACAVWTRDSLEGLYLSPETP